MGGIRLAFAVGKVPQWRLAAYSTFADNLCLPVVDAVADR